VIDAGSSSVTGFPATDSSRRSAGAIFLHGRNGESLCRKSRFLTIAGDSDRRLLSVGLTATAKTTLVAVSNFAVVESLA
jgi:hypothetical protein